MTEFEQLLALLLPALEELLKEQENAENSDNLFDFNKISSIQCLRR